MNLTAAGVISGAGNAAKEGIAEQQKFNLLQQLENSRQNLEDMRQTRNLEAQRAMHIESLKAAAEQGELTRAHQEKIAEAHNTVLKDLEEKRQTHAEAMTRQQIGSAESVAELNRRSAEAIHDADRKLKKYEIEETSKSHTEATYSKAITEIGYEITRLNAIIKDPLADKTSPEYKDVLTRLTKLTGLYDRYTSALAPKGEATPAAPGRPPIRNPFSTPSASPTPSGVPGPASTQATAPRPRGILQMPMPSADEQELMRKSIAEE